MKDKLIRLLQENIVERQLLIKLLKEENNETEPKIPVRKDVSSDKIASYLDPLTGFRVTPNKGKGEKIPYLTALFRTILPGLKKHPVEITPEIQEKKDLFNQGVETLKKMKAYDLISKFRDKLNNSQNTNAAELIAKMNELISKSNEKKS